MNSFVLILLGIIQGLTEFLPISSSGHLVLMYKIFHVENNVKLLSILLHIATLLSVLVYYRHDIIRLIRHPFCKTNRKILLTTIFTCGVVLAIKPLIDKSFNGNYLYIFFIITAMLLFISDFLSSKNENLSKNGNIFAKSKISTNEYNITDLPISYTQAIAIGVAQGVACVPGISRSGATITVGKMTEGKDTARYSFLISIPIIIASMLLEIVEGDINLVGIKILPLIVSMVICFLVGLICIKFMTRLVSSCHLSIFGYYLLTLSTILVILSFFGI